ncbi:MAG: hypothetical protein ACRD96_10440 [Bryobacteraceae bacterium]
MFRAYRDATPDPEASVNFMPALWSRIERARSTNILFRRISRGFVTAAAALSILLAVFAFDTRSEDHTAFVQTYVETLADSQSIDNVEYVETDSVEADGEPEWL